jgi:hypothetical protein
MLTALALCNLARVKAFRAAMIKDDAIKTLLPLTSEKMAETRRCVVAPSPLP